MGGDINNWPRDGPLPARALKLEAARAHDSNELISALRRRIRKVIIGNLWRATFSPDYGGALTNRISIGSMRSRVRCLCVGEN